MNPSGEIAEGREQRLNSQDLLRGAIAGTRGSGPKLKPWKCHFKQEKLYFEVGWTPEQLFLPTALGNLL